jgi:hypothetical protein
MEQQNWAKIYSTDAEYKAEIAKDVLENEGITCIIMDKKDSAYGAFGELELYVQRENVLKAKHILNSKELHP